MLKLIETLRNGSFRLAPRSSTWCISNYQTVSACSSAATASQDKVHTKTVIKSNKSGTTKERSNFSKVQLVFDTLANDAAEQAKSKESQMVLEILHLANNKHIDYNSAKVAVDTLKKWVRDGKIQLENFENNPKYQKLLRINQDGAMEKKLGNKPTMSANLIINEIDDAYNDVSKMPIAETIKILSGLAMKQRRIKPLLLTIASNISRREAPLSIKNIADILYCMTVLNFPDMTLLEKLCHDLSKSVNTVSQSPIIGSIVTSLGMMRYRDDKVLDSISEWVVQHKNILRPQDLCALLMSLATVGYNPVNSDVLFKELVSTLREIEMSRSSEWLDVVWALTILNQVTPVQLESVLNTKFIGKLLDPDNIPLVRKRKLLNINASAKYLIGEYSGPYLPDDSQVFEAPFMNKKDKQIFVKAIADALANLLPSRKHFNINVDIATGFVLDAEFFMDKQRTPLTHDQATKHTDALRIAIVAHHYHDFCLGGNWMLGPILLHQRLLQAKGYRLLDISHANFHPDDKLLNRISYINDRIKSVVK